MPVHIQLDKQFRESWDCKLVSWFIRYRWTFFYIVCAIIGMKLAEIWVEL